jgi:LmbE family N-acetylglucosaminyl deacetylase/GT2 family glycosyltransferase
VSSYYPALADLNQLPNRALAFAPHADDEVFGCGGTLAFHAGRGDAVRAVILTDGAGGDPAGLEADIAKTRRAESLAAGAELGVTDYQFLDFPDGGLAASFGVVEALLEALRAFQPLCVYGPGLQEMHPDHRALCEALLDAMAIYGAEVPEARLYLYGINAQVQANVMFDITTLKVKKRRAVERFESQLAYHDLVGKTEAVDLARTVNIEDAAVYQVEAFLVLDPARGEAYRTAMSALMGEVFPGTRAELPVDEPQTSNLADDDPMAATAVISVWNRIEALRANLDGLLAQTRPFADIVVVDNASTDGTAEMVTAEYPQVRLVRMPNSAYGACETFNVGFASVTTPLLAILDDDVVLPPEWLDKCVARLAQEPPTTAVISTKVVEPEMPESYKNSELVNAERYMSTFRGCGSLARTAALREAGWYDEYLFIYGNERDLTCRLLNLGYRVLQYSGVETFHRQPFGVQMGKRSLYFHARNAWITMLKYAPLKDLVRMPWLVLTRVLLRTSASEAEGSVADATGTIGIGRAVRETPGAFWILVRASWGVVRALPHVWKHRAPVHSPDFDLPLK